ncbi:MAG: ATP-binding protein [Candidatus Aenigmarchaeota archaeon]|nr:ATP-binding protein [Candidatus Aenigmarchaeota archaeon]
MTKIAVIGSHFVGKTTLVKKLSTHTKAEIVEEVARSCPYPVNEIATLEAQEWILKEQKSREKRVNANIIITDRGLIDNFAYWMRVAEKYLDKKDIEKRKKEVFEYSRSYDIIFFLEPFDGEIKNDNFRSLNKEWRKEMHNRIFELVQEFKEIHSGNIYFLKGSEDEIFQQAIDILKQLKII